MKKMERVELVPLTREESRLVAGGALGGEIFGEVSYGEDGGADFQIGIRFRF